MLAWKVPFMRLAVALVAAFLFVRPSNSLAQEVGPPGGIAPPPPVVGFWPGPQNTPKLFRKCRKTMVLAKWLNRQGFEAIPDGGTRIDFRDKNGMPLNDQQICCEIELLMAALRKVLADNPDIGPNNTQIPVLGEDDTTEPLQIQVGGRIALIRLLLGTGKHGGADASGKNGDTVIVGGKDREPGAGSEAGQDATAHASEGGTAITSGGNGRNSTNDTGGNGGDSTSDGGNRSKAYACGGRGGDGGPGHKGGHGGKATTRIKRTDGPPPTAADPGKAGSDGGRGGNGGDDRGEDGGGGGKGGPATASVEDGRAGSSADSHAGNAGNAGQSKPDATGKAGQPGEAANGADAHSGGAANNHATGGNSGSGRHADSAKPGKGFVNGHGKGGKEGAGAVDGSRAPGGNPEDCVDYFNALAGVKTGGLDILVKQLLDP